MNRFLTAFCALTLVLSGCATHKKGAAYVDPYDDVRVEQTTGNYISGQIFGKTLFCLNARRETHRVTALTNQVVTLVTNPVVSSITNFYSTTTTNFAGGLATNQLPPPVTNVVAVATNNETLPVAIVQAPPSAMTNTSVTKTVDTVSTTNVGNFQAAATVNTQTGITSSSQVTSNADNMAITVLSNETVRTETSRTITTVTNFNISSVTNHVVLQTNQLVIDHYLFTELTPPPDFTLASGESLVLSVDGVRHGFSPTNSTTAFVERRGFVSTLYKVPPEVLVAIANAREVKIRLKGVNKVIERDMPSSARRHFKSFLLKYYTTESTNVDPIPTPIKAQSAPVQAQPTQPAWVSPIPTPR